MKYEFKTVSSLEKIFLNTTMDINEQTCGSMLKNEIYSFQLAARLEEHNYPTRDCVIEINSPLAKYITLYSVDNVPVVVTHMPGLADDDFISKEPGLYPDCLNKITNGLITLGYNQTRGFWFCVEPNGEITGEYPIEIKISETDGTEIATLTYTLKIIDKCLPKQELYATGWFHGDCIAKLHKAEAMSDRYFELCEKYIRVYTKFGHNMILTPVFTPPLDTDIGKYRPVNQLVGIKCTDGKYSFDFTYLKKWIDICHKNGVEYFEICHLFTQWGAEFTPQIMAEVDGEYKRIFGWDVKALSDEYKEFLSEFLPELKEFLIAEKVYDNCFFHLSDEPTEKHLEQYASIRALVTPYIDENKLMDALSKYDFYEKGLVKNPVAANDHIHTFIEHNAPNMWTYYCCIQGIDVANRFIAMPAYRSRVLGYQLYKYDIKGFLQWGYNFWFSQLSRKIINPYLDTNASGGFPAGDSFLVYPTNHDDEVVCSTRIYVFNEALQDMRALKLLEELAGKEKAHSLLGEIDGFGRYPRSNDYYIELRQKINDEIEKYC